MPTETNIKMPIWDHNAGRWVPPIGELERLELVREYAPDSAYPSGGTAKSTAEMVAALCPIELLQQTSPEELRRKLSQVSFLHKASTPYDDDEYWAAQSPFDRNYYIFASFAMGGGWPTRPAYVLDHYPDWFDRD